MRRSTGAIFRDSRPATIIRSDWRGEPRKTSAPKRAMSYRDALIAIISIAQHARPNVTGQIDDRRAQFVIFSTVVVSTGISGKSGISIRIYRPGLQIRRMLFRRRTSGLEPWPSDSRGYRLLAVGPQSSTPLRHT